MQIETESWQALVQYLAQQIGKGYYYYQVVKYPKKKQDEWYLIDKKMIERFDVNISKYKRYRRKNEKGWANFLLIRYQERLYVLMTDGEAPPKIDLTGERFLDIRKQALQIQLGKIMSLVITRGDKKVDVYMTSDHFRDRKAFILELAKSKALGKIKKDLSLLKGLPGYRGINKQREQLVNIAVKSLRKNQLQVDRKDFATFFKGTKQKKVFKEDND